MSDQQQMASRMGISAYALMGLPESAVLRRQEEDAWLRRQEEMARIDSPVRVLTGRRMWDREAVAAAAWLGELFVQFLRRYWEWTKVVAAHPVTWAAVIAWVLWMFAFAAGSGRMP